MSPARGRGGVVAYPRPPAIPARSRPCRTWQSDADAPGLDSRLRGSDVGRLVWSFRRPVSPRGRFKAWRVHLNGAGSKRGGECAARSVALNAIPMWSARRELRPVRHSRAGGNPEGRGWEMWRGRRLREARGLFPAGAGVGMESVARSKTTRG